MASQMPGNGTLSRAGRAVDGDDHLPGRPKGAQEAFIRTHPRFFVSCLGGTAKPNRLLFPDFVPADKADL